MCNLRRAKNHTSKPSAHEGSQQSYPLNLYAGQQQQDPRSAPPALPSPRYPRSGTEDGVSPRNSIRSYSTNQSLEPGEIPERTAKEPSDAGVSIENLPAELLEAIFLLAIQTSFPVEDPNWPAYPMFSKRSYQPSLSGSGLGIGAVPRTPPSSAGFQMVTPTMLTSAQHLLPTILSQTCRRFRFILRHAPHLWSYICITRTVSPHQGQPPLLARQVLGWLPIYLARARESPLHLILDTMKFASFSAPISHGSTPASPGLAVHPQSILALLMPTLSRWSSVTILTSHIGSATLAPLLELLSPLAVPNLSQFRVAADIWRPGIVGYGTPIPRLFAGGSPMLDSVVLEGVPLDWKSCAGGGTLGGNEFAILLEEGCPRLERLVVRDDFEEVLRTLDPPPLPHIEHHPDLPSRSTGTSISASGRTSLATSTSTSTRIHGHLAGLNITLPASTSQGERGRRSQSTSSSSSSRSSSSSSSPNSSTYPRHQGNDRKHRSEREFRKIHLPGLKHLEVHAFNSSGSRSSLFKSHSSSAPAHSRNATGVGVEPPPPPPVARFLQLLSVPSIHTLGIMGVDRDEWPAVAGVLGLPVHVAKAAKGSPGKVGTPPGGPGRVYPFLTTLAVEFVDD
ncbi:hypothetical protein NMY22_g3097 [Coprinellus aureogranulatus]|nr:hypothetical protein NMY22_g3097 [Coprinellus aureogranulatus]